MGAIGRLAMEPKDIAPLTSCGHEAFEDGRHHGDAAARCPE